MAFMVFNICVFAALVSPAVAASGFLSTQHGDLLAEIEGAIGAEAAGGRIAAMEAVLRPTYAAMPKNRHGRLEHAAVRSMLHRLFVQLHGWVITGLEPGNSTSETAPMGIDLLRGQVTARAEQLFEHRLGAGFGLHEVAAVAVAMERLIHNEASDRLQSAFERLSLPTETPLDASTFEKTLDAYMVLYLLGNSLGDKKYAMQKLIPAMPKLYPGWQDTRSFVLDTAQNIDYAKRHRTNPFLEQTPDFQRALRVVEAVGERFGQYQDVECQELKEALVAREVRGSGRVWLSDFYKLGLEGKFLLKESVDYLRSLGALDEFGAREPRVIVPNFILSKSNCLASTSLYTVCCINECEPLMAHLEREIAAPAASPARIAALVAALPSPSVDAPRNLSDAMLGRLDEIAAQHHGAVMLHGRLFSQWMHHAFPRECPYPHMSGTTASMASSEWQSASGSKVTMENAELQRYLDTSAGMPMDEEGDELMPWHPEEELLVKSGESLSLTLFRSVHSAGRGIMLVAAIASIAVGLLRAPKSSLVGAGGKQLEAHYV